MYWTKSNFPSKCDFKFYEEKIKHSLIPCEGIVKFRHTLLVSEKRLQQTNKASRTTYRNQEEMQLISLKNILAKYFYE